MSDELHNLAQATVHFTTHARELQLARNRLADAIVFCSYRRNYDGSHCVRDILDSITFHFEQATLAGQAVERFSCAQWCRFADFVAAFKKDHLIIQARVWSNDPAATTRDLAKYRQT